MTLPSSITFRASGETILRTRRPLYCPIETSTERPRSVEALTSPARSEMSPAVRASDMLSDMMSRGMK